MPERLGVIVVARFKFTFALSIIYMAVIFCCYSSFIYQALLLTVSIKWAVVLIPAVALWRIFLSVVLQYFGVVFFYVIYHIGGAAVAYFYSAQVIFIYRLCRKYTYLSSILKEMSYSVKQQKEVSSDRFMINGNLTADNKEIANGFCRFFAEISKRIKASVFSISACSSIWKYHENTCLTGKLNPARSRFIF